MNQKILFSMTLLVGSSLIANDAGNTFLHNVHIAQERLFNGYIAAIRRLESDVDAIERMNEKLKKEKKRLFKQNQSLSRRLELLLKTQERAQRGARQRNPYGKISK